MLKDPKIPDELSLFTSFTTPSGVLFKSLYFKKNRHMRMVNTNCIMMTWTSIIQSDIVSFRGNKASTIYLKMCPSNIFRLVQLC